MAIEAITSIRNNNSNNVHFEARKNKKSAPLSNPTVTSTVKAVPLAVLLAMSPMTTTNAENIMRGESISATIEIAQTQNRPVVLFHEKIITQNGLTVFVNGINSKGETTSIDKIKLSARKGDKGVMEDFTVKSVVDRELYLLSYNGVKEGPLRITQVNATSENDNTTYSFIDPVLTGYVKALVEHPYNKSYIKKDTRSDDMVIYFDSYHIPDKEEITYIPTTINRGNKNFGRPLTSLTREVQGSHGIYTIRLYAREDKPGQHRLTIQKKGEDEFQVESVNKYDIKLLGVDAKLPSGVITEIDIAGNKGDKFSAITDDLLGDELLKIREKYNYPYSHDKISSDSYLEP